MDEPVRSSDGGAYGAGGTCMGLSLNGAMSLIGDQGWQARREMAECGGISLGPSYKAIYHLFPSPFTTPATAG